MRNKLGEFVGWYGMIAILLGFFLVSFHYLSVDSAWYQLLGLTGGIGIAVSAYQKQAYPATALNVVYASIAFIALVNIVLKF